MKSLIEKLTPDLFKNKARLQRELETRRNAIVVAERCLTLCDVLEREIPDKISALRTPLALPRLPVDTAGEAPCRDAAWLRQARAAKALKALADDIPEIRRHWQAKLKELTN